ncbi:hypothetical protein [Micromonospora matsumotoense]|uniref:hypothetical protein n=1 Tax=Micromonospora matsumotoense TaxID=121616 RepID=UPI0033C4DF76
MARQAGGDVDVFDGTRAFGPSVTVAPTRYRSRPYCISYARSAQLLSGKIAATYNNQPLDTNSPG